MEAWGGRMEGRNCRHPSFRGGVEVRFSAGVCFRPKAHLHHPPTLPDLSNLKLVSKTPPTEHYEGGWGRNLPFLIGETLTSKRKMKCSGSA